MGYPIMLQTEKVLEHLDNIDKLIGEINRYGLNGRWGNQLATESDAIRKMIEDAK